MFASANLEIGWWRAGTYVGSLVFAIAWTVLLGKDLHWDAINYHLYAGFSALNDRFTQDFFASGTTAYLNPYSHVPLYLMWRSGWSALAMAIFFATAHAFVLWLVFELVVAAFPRDQLRGAGVFAAIAVVFAASNPVLLQVLGSTMNDLSVGALVIGAWLALAIGLSRGSWRLVVIAGALFGLASALKLSNAVFAIAAAATVVVTPDVRDGRLRAFIGLCASCTAAFVLGSLPWSAALWREFGNPVFPFLNQHFQSPDFITSPLKQERFVPLTWREFLARPFEMLMAESAIHVEPRAPDVRYMAVMATGLAWAFVRALCTPPRANEVGERGENDDSARRDATYLATLVAGFVIAWCLWLTISGNSRYFIPMACIASAIFAIVLRRVYLRCRPLAVGLLAVTFTIQGLQLAMGADLRREGHEWEGPWVRVEIPERLRTEPHFFLAPGILSASIFIPYMHPDTGWMNVAGFYVIGPGHPGGERAQRLIDRNSGRLRFLLGLPEGVVDRSTLPGPPENLKSYFRRFGLRVDASDCEFIRLEGNVRGERRPQGDRWKHFISCRLVPAPDERLAYEREVAAYEVIFDRVEDTCPNLFFPPRPVTQEGIYWARTYHSGSEMQLFVDGNRVKYFYYLRGGDPIDIGSTEDWSAGSGPIDCAKRTQPAFQNIVR